MRSNLFVLGLFAYLSSSCQHQLPAEDHRPNILLIVADDLGYSDLGCFGGEISTPNIDQLAAQGRIFTNFYTAATCSPTRAMLLSGNDNHIAGLGNMAEPMLSIPQQLGKPGYEGYLNDRVISISQLLKDEGYHTYIAGKWHLGLTPEQSPYAKGFERSFTLMDAATNHFYPYRDNRFWEDDDFGSYPNGEFSSNVYTDKMIEFLGEDQSDGRPFFLMAAYTAPHWPLQAPREFINKYEGRYDIGYDSLRSLRLASLKNKGLIPVSVSLPELPGVEGNLYDISNRPLIPWDQLNDREKKIEARKMEIYAAMIDNLDSNIGRLIAYLKQIKKYDNTMVIFLSDNGAAVLDYNYTPDGFDVYQTMGTANSFVAYGSPWAHASSAAFRLYKGYSAEGGIRTPLIVKMPAQKEAKTQSDVFTTVMDIAPTLLELAEGTYPEQYEGQLKVPYKGESLLPYLSGLRETVHSENYIVGWELFGRFALRKGDWKITQVEPPFGKGQFELYNIKKDPSESMDLSREFPVKYNELLNHWSDYLKDNGVILLKN